ncbi:neutral zinc metallopeptidase [Hasllibacter sp. MH4015]|uniref:KPN_02809 family neutral zinc metallopeptidase n=1 Tax=Hasllibacter sp. MH4015 TaxID=2854029 RepID=UPI001CD620AC|nr:neutral zinc metallopeptidase [Hasllibacter sp. MH4015]
MRLRNRRSSRNVIDRRRSGGRARGGGSGRAAGAGGLGLLAVVVIGYFLGVDLTPLLNNPGGVPQQQTQTRGTGPLSAEEQQAGEFASRVLATTEDVWAEVYPASFGAPYDPPTLVLFSGATQSGCGGAQAATGPFYCPADERAYLDTAFFAYMSRQLGAGGDFAAAYVIAHEVAHHVQNELGILAEANRIRASSSQTQSNRISVMLELQADCFSGVWASRLGDILEPGDLDEALNAARRIGDDYLQTRGGGVARPHTFTHGTSEQRARWFTIGYQTGDPNQCDTFAADRL